MALPKRVVRTIYAVTVAAGGVVATGLSQFTGWAPVLAAAPIFAGVLTYRVTKLAHDQTRPRWLTAFNLLTFWLWLGLVLCLPLFIVASLLLPWLGISLAWLAISATLLSLVCAAWGMTVRRRAVVVRHFDVELSGLHPDFNGYKILQLTDLHIGSYDGKARGLRWAELANAQQPDLIVVTGDLVTSGTEFYADAADVLGALRAPDGVIVSMGNHDQWDNPQLVQELRSRNLIVLLNAWRALRRGAGQLIVAGLDDRFSKKDDLTKTLEGRPALPTVLLSHYPDFFEAAAERGVDLVLSGHTHGGQIGLPGLAHRINFSSLMGHRGRGFFHHGKAQLYVNAGLGTTGPPIRLGIPPEIAVFALRSTE